MQNQLRGGKPILSNGGTSKQPAIAGFDSVTRTSAVSLAAAGMRHTTPIHPIARFTRSRCAKRTRFILFARARVKPFLQIESALLGPHTQICFSVAKEDLTPCNENSVCVSGTQHLPLFFTNTLQRFCGIATIATFTIIYDHQRIAPVFAILTFS
jgi:hypothetical protein